jgi:hypothetical protein
VLPLWDYSYRLRPSKLGFHLQAQRAIGLSPCQLNNMVVETISRTCHFDVPVATHPTVSWPKGRHLGPLIDHARQTVGFESLDLPIHNLIAQNEGGPDLAHWATEGHSTGSGFLLWV